MKVRVVESSESWEVFPVEEINGRFVFRAHRNPPIVQKEEIKPQRAVSQPSQQLLDDLLNLSSSSSSSASSTPRNDQLEQVQSIPLEVDLKRRLEDLPAEFHAEEPQRGLLDAIIEKCRQPPQEFLPLEPLLEFPVPTSADDYIPPIPPLEDFQFDFPTPSPSLTPSPQEENNLLINGTTGTTTATTATTATTNNVSSSQIEVQKSKILAKCFGPSRPSHKPSEKTIAKPPKSSEPSKSSEAIFRVPEVPKPRPSKPHSRRPNYHTEKPQISREERNLGDQVENILKAIRDFKLPRCLSPIRELRAPEIGKRRSTFDGYRIPKIPRKEVQEQRIVHDSGLSVKDSIFQRWATAQPTNKPLTKSRLQKLRR